MTHVYWSQKMVDEIKPETLTHICGKTPCGPGYAGNMCQLLTLTTGRRLFNPLSLCACLLVHTNGIRMKRSRCIVDSYVRIHGTSKADIPNPKQYI